MTNPERDPDEIVCTTGAATVEVMVPREVPLGGPRAMHVRRTLPQRDRSLIGAWCFLDHYGPDQVADSGGMSVAPHPHDSGGSASRPPGTTGTSTPDDQVPGATDGPR